MVVVGLLAAAFLGLMALRGITMLFMPASADPFLFPLQFSIPLALVFGLVVTYFTGAWLGLFGTHVLHNYDWLRRKRGEVVKRPDDRPAVPETTIKY